MTMVCWVKFVIFATFLRAALAAGPACTGSKINNYGICITEAGTSCAKNQCCEGDKDYCEHSGTTKCKDPNHYFDPTKKTVNWRTHASGDPTVACCEVTQNCASFTTCDSQQKGLKQIANAATKKCVGACTAAQCCEPDQTKCGENYACSGDTYFSKADRADTAKGATPATACCQNKADCSAGFTTCASQQKGLKLKAGAKCPTNAASCTHQTCCEKDDNKCGENFACSGDTYFSAAGRADSAKGANAATACCQNKADCGPFTGCIAADGLSLKANANTFKCPSDQNSCTKEICCTEQTCKGLAASVTCIKGYTVRDATKDVKAATSDNKNYVCCKPETPWVTCPSPSSNAPGQSTPNTPGSNTGSGSGVVGSPSGAFEKFQPMVYWNTALVVTIVSLRL